MSQSAEEGRSIHDVDLSKKDVGFAKRHMVTKSLTCLPQRGASKVRPTQKNRKNLMLFLDWKSERPR